MSSCCLCSEQIGQDILQDVVPDRWELRNKKALSGSETLCAVCFRKDGSWWMLPCGGEGLLSCEDLARRLRRPDPAPEPQEAGACCVCVCECVNACT